MVGGAWPFLVGGVICQVNSVNERDLGVVARGLVQSRTRLLLPTRTAGDIVSGSPRQ